MSVDSVATRRAVAGLSVPGTVPLPGTATGWARPTLVRVYSFAEDTDPGGGGGGGGGGGIVDTSISIRIRIGKPELGAKAKRRVTAIKLSSLSTQYVKVPVTLTENGALANPTSDAVELAFTSSISVEPEESDWAEGSWETSGHRHLARVLVGPDGVLNPGDGTWVVWVRLHRAPQTIVLQGSTVVVT